MMVLYHLGVPLDEASAQRPRIGGYKEYSIDDPSYDVLIYSFDGRSRKEPVDVVKAGIKAIRRGGFRHTKKMTLIVFENLTARDKSHKVIFPYGIFLESSDIRNSSIPTKDLAKKPLVVSPMNWDRRINEWIYSTNADFEGPKITENPSYTKSAQIAEMGWFMDLDELKTKSEVTGKFGQPKYLVEENGKYSEVYLVDDVNRNQTGTVRIWYEADKVTKTGCYMENK